MTNDSKDQGREAFEAWAKSTGLDILSAPGWSNADYISLPTEDAWRGFKAALATSASALARDEASVAPIREPLQDSGEPNVWPVPLEIETNYEIGQTVELIFEDDADAERFSRLYSQHMGTAVSPAASSAATVSDAASVAQDEEENPTGEEIAEATQEFNRACTRDAVTTAGAQDEPVTWDNTRHSLAVAMSAFATRPLGGRGLDAAVQVLDAITEPGSPLSWLRAASSATAPLTSDSVERALDRVLKQSKNPLFRSGAKICAAEILSPTKPCTKPPEGWTCSRFEGHEGPCAASPAASNGEQEVQS